MQPHFTTVSEINSPWRHGIDTLFTLLGLCEGNSPVTSGPKQRTSKSELWCFLCCWPGTSNWTNSRESDDNVHICLHCKAQEDALHVRGMVKSWEKTNKDTRYITTNVTGWGTKESTDESKGDIWPAKNLKWVNKNAYIYSHNSCGASWFNTMRPRQNGRHHFQTTFSNVFSCIKMYKFPLRFHWSLFPWSN